MKIRENLEGACHTNHRKFTNMKIYTQTINTAFPNMKIYTHTINTAFPDNEVENDTLLQGISFKYQAQITKSYAA